MTTYCNARIPANSHGLRTYGDKHPIPAPNFGLDVPARDAPGRIRWTKPFSEECPVGGAGIHAVGLGTYPDDSPILHLTKHREVAIGRLIQPNGEFPVDDLPPSETLFNNAREEFMAPDARFPE
jgi:hypothetical protein